MNEDETKVVDAVVVGNAVLCKTAEGSVIGQRIEELRLPAELDPDGLAWKAILRAAYPMRRFKDDWVIAPIPESRNVSEAP